MTFANMHCRKRSGDLLDEPPTPTVYSPWDNDNDAWIDRNSIRSESLTFDPPPSPKRRVAFPTRRSSMPLQLSPVMPVTYPTFMSVIYGEDENTDNDEIGSNPVIKSELQLASSIVEPNTHPAQFTLFRHSSTTSLQSESTESSPSTSASTFDSPIISDPSPSSSPESATSAVPISPFENMLRTPEIDRSTAVDSVTATHPPVSTDTSPIEPAQGLRNVKNLSLNMNAVLNPQPEVPLSSSGFHAFSAPTSPVREPLKSARRKPVGLTIKTPVFQPQGFSKAFEVPPTPRSRPNLPNIATTPLLPSRSTSSIPSLAKLSLPSVPMTPHARGSSQSGFRAGPQNGELSAVAEELNVPELPKSQEAPERGYTEGPVRVYDSGVYLFLEPTADEAREFDLIINVAKEIKDPFADGDQKADSVMKVWRNGNEHQEATNPQTAVAERSFRSDATWPSFKDHDSFTTSLTQTSEKQKTPEYLHVPWDHNSEILDDLYPLCCLIDERVQHGKRVLVHCQLGVSRSASLIIAYGLYKGYQADFHSMYMAVKERSRWVGPNMSLIYQLTDFRGKINQEEYSESAKQPLQSWWKHGTPPTGARSPVAPKNAAPNGLPSKPEESYASQSVCSNQLMTKSNPTFIPIEDLPPLPDTPGDYGDRMEGILFSKPLPPIPSLMGPPSLPASALKLANNFPTKDSKKKKPATRPLPFRERYEMKVPEIPPHRPRPLSLTTTTISHKPPQMDLAMKDVPETPSLFSPRTTHFIANPFGIRGAGDLAINHKRVPSIQQTRHEDLSGPKGDARPPTLIFRDDPRSPAMQGNQTIVYRSIDDFL